MSVLYSPSLKYSQELTGNPEMDPNIGHPQQHCHQPNFGLLRYRSAPGTLLASLMDNSHGCISEEAFTAVDNKSYLPPSNTEMESMLAKLISANIGWSNSESSNEYGGKPVKQEAGESVPEQNAYSYGSHVIYQAQQVQGLANANLSGGNGFDGSLGVMNTMALENSTQSKVGPKNCSNLVRQKSSPAGFLSNSSIENGFAALSRSGQSPSTTGFSGHVNLRPTSCPRRMPQIAENGSEGMESSCVQSKNLGNDNNSSRYYMPSFTNDFWENSAYNAQKTSANNDDLLYSTSEAFEIQNAELGYQNLGLTHHLSLPGSSTKMSSMEKFLHIQGSAPCKVRAKRGFATHPRSIAERIRRTRISERIKKLQELFPKSDKQTSTADMLDLAVEYIKNLQKQVKILSNTRARCTCSSSQNQKHYSR